MAGCPSAKQNWAKPPVGRYFRRRSASTCRRTTSAWYACVASLQDSKVSCSAGGTNRSKIGRWSPWVCASRSQSRSGQRSGSQKSAVVGHGLRPELGDEPRHARHRPQEPGEVALVAVVPAEVEVAVRAVELRRVRQHARVGDDRPGAVGPLEGALDRAVEHGLVPGGQLLRGEGLHGHLAELPGLAPHGGIVLDRHRLVVPAPDGDGRVVAQELHRRGRLAHGLLADAPGVPPLQREVLPQEEAALVGGVVELGPGDVGVHPQEVEARRRARGRRRGRGRRGWPRPAPCASGPGSSP